MQLEPPGPHVHGGPTAPSLTLSLTPLDVRAAAAAAAVVLVLTGRGDAFLLAVLLGLTAFDAMAGIAAGTAAVVLLARWGSSSLAAAAGAQSVLGLGFLVGPPVSAAATVLAAAAVLAAAPSGFFAPVFGAAAGIVLAGPSFATLPGGAVRLLAVVLGGLLAWYAVPRVPDRIRGRLRFAAPALGALAALLAVVG